MSGPYSRLDALRAKARADMRGGLLFFGAAALAGFLSWASVAELDEVAVAMGEVAPRGSVRAVQHLEGGVAAEILVREGAPVKAGDPLLQIDLAPTSLNPEELQAQLDARKLTRARLTAEAEGREPVFPTEEAARRPSLLANEQAQYATRRKQLETSLAAFDSRVAQAEAEIAEIKARRAALVEALTLAKRKLEMTRGLVKDKLAPKLELVTAEQEAQQRQAELELNDQALPRLEAAAARARLERQEAETKFRAAALADLNELELVMVRIEEQLARANDQSRRTTVRAPVDGVVQNVKVLSVGDVIAPGATILEIVPTRDKLVVHARVSPTDRGYVRVGQPATVKVTAYDFIRYGSLEGRVAGIDATTRLDEAKQPYYRVEVETDRASLDEAGDLPIASGMQAAVDIHTGRRTVLDFLIGPVLKLKHEALRER